MPVHKKKNKSKKKKQRKTKNNQNKKKILDEIGPEMDMLVSNEDNSNIENKDFELNADAAKQISKKQEKNTKYHQHEILDNNPETMENKQYIDRTPSLIGVLGNSDQTIKSFIKKISETFYGKSSLFDMSFSILPPITLRSAKTRRSTFLHLNNIHSRIDGLKICDLSIILIDCDEIYDQKISNEDQFKNTLKILFKDYVEYTNMVKSNGNNKIIFHLINYNPRNHKFLFSLMKKYFNGIFIITSFKKLVHVISCLKNKVTYLKCSNSYLVIDDLKDKQSDEIKKSTFKGEITIKGFLRGKPLLRNQSGDFYIPSVGRVNINQIERIEDPICIENEKILERKKVFFHAPIMCQKEEEIEEEKKEDEKKKFKLFDHDFEYESSSNEQIEEKNCDTEGRDLDQGKIEAKENAVNKEDESRTDSSSLDDSIKSDSSKYQDHNGIEEHGDENLYRNESYFYPGDYLKVTMNLEKEICFNGLLILNKIHTEHKEQLRCTSFNSDKYFHPNFIKSYDPVIFSVGLFRMITFPVFFRVLEDGRRLFQKNSRNMSNMKCCFYGYGGKSMPVMIIRQIKSEYEAQGDKSQDQYKPKMKQQFDKKNKNEIKSLLNSINIRHNYRIIGTGQIQNENIENLANKKEIISNDYIYKKLNLIGRVYKSSGTTSFVQNMFNSTLEANKFILSNIKTISGIRGIIKKSVNTSGSIRCTFEAPVKIDDTVLLSTFIRISVLETFFESNDEYYRKKREIQENEKEETSDSSELYGDEIAVENELRAPTFKKLIAKLPLSKRMEKEEIVNEEFCLKSNNKIKKYIQDKRKEKIEIIQKEKERILNEEKIQKEEKSRIKREGIHKRIKGIRK